MAKERIRKVAKRFDLPVEKVISTLASMGHGRYRLPDDMLPDPILAEIEPVLKRTRAAMPKEVKPRLPVLPELDARIPPGGRDVPLPDAIPDDPVLNAALQEYRSAMPLMELRKTLPAQQTAKTAAPVNQPPSKEQVLRDSLGAEIRQRRLLSEALDQARAELSQTRTALATREASTAEREAALKHALEKARSEGLERIQTLESHVTRMTVELEQLRVDEPKLRRELELVRTRLTDELVARQVAEGRVAQLERKIKELEARPDPKAPEPRGGADSTPVAPLDELFEQRGLGTPEEVRHALEALLREGHYHETMELLATSSPAALRALLKRRLAVVCENCEPPAGAAVMRVGELARCEVCKGSSTNQASQAFLNACRAHGIGRVNIVGGSPRYLAELRQLLGGALELRGVDGTTSLDGRRARQHVEGADLTIVWGASLLDHKVSNLYTDLDDPRVVQVRHRGIGGMLRLAAEAIERRRLRGGAPAPARS